MLFKTAITATCPRGQESSGYRVYRVTVARPDQANLGKMSYGEAPHRADARGRILPQRGKSCLRLASSRATEKERKPKIWVCGGRKNEEQLNNSKKRKKTPPPPTG